MAKNSSKIRLSKEYAKHVLIKLVRKGIFIHVEGVLDKLLMSVRRFFNRGHIELCGPYDSWDDALSASTGYDSDVVLTKVLNATELVLKGNASYERDGTVFESEPARWKLKEVLNEITRERDIVVDFGGGLGGCYLYNLKPAKYSVELEYYVVEQPRLVDIGRNLAKKFNLPIKYTASLLDVPANPKVIILSCVLQYVNEWKDVLGMCIAKAPSFILVDRQLLVETATSICVQDNGSYYGERVSYPINRINRSDFMLQLAEDYDVVEEWKSEFDPPDHYGYLFQLKSSATNNL